MLPWLSFCETTPLLLLQLLFCAVVVVVVGFEAKTISKTFLSVKNGQFFTVHDTLMSFVAMLIV